jgi:hypothetical protein
MKKILLVADQPGWIFDRHCKEIQKRITEYKIDIAYRKHHIQALSQDYDLVYVLDPIPMQYPPQEKTIMGLRCEFLYEEHPNGAKGLYESGLPGRCVSIKDKCSILHVVNKNQIKIMGEVVKDKPLLLAQHGIDEMIFNRDLYEKKKNDVLTVSVSGRGSQNKGFNFIQQACQEIGCRAIGATYGRQKLTKEQMPSFYNEADVHVCMSLSEGLNNPTMEAGAMGVPVISTRCGAAEEMIKDGVNGILIDRDVESLKTALRTLQNDDLRLDMGDKFHYEITQNWTWDRRIEDFRQMFDLFFDGSNSNLGEEQPWNPTGG